MTFASNRLVWFPFYALPIGWLVWHFRRRAAVLLPLVAVAVTLADSITSRFFKPFFARLRPCHNPALAAQLYLPDGCGGQFGFLSSHAANGFALAVFLLLTLPAGRFRALKVGVFFVGQPPLLQPRLPGGPLPHRRTGRAPHRGPAGLGRGG